VHDWSVFSSNWPRCCSGNCLGFYSGGVWVSLGWGTSCPDWECSWYTSVSPLKLQDNNFVTSQQFLWILSNSSYTSHLLLSNYKEQSLFWEADISSATQKNSPVLWKLKVPYCVYKIMILVPIRSQWNQCTLYLYSSLKFILILSSHLHLGLPCSLFPSDFPIRIMYTFLWPACHMSCHALSCEMK
jgi:hypothetical protein